MKVKNYQMLKKENNMFLKKISILLNNYVWILVNAHGFCIIIDPGLSEPIIQEIKRKNWHPIAILLTHNHIDHTAGVKEIIQFFPNITVFGPYETKQHSVNKIVKEGNKIIILNNIFYVFSTPGHTLGHVSYYCKPYLFCGDTLFSGGCGRVYKKRYLEMYRSIKKLSSFPDSTMLCCSHEYTISNLKFSRFLFPDDNLIKSYIQNIQRISKLRKSSLPSYILFEKKINLFLRTSENSLKDILGLRKNCTSYEVFIELRLKKDLWS